ncbi:MAG: hypothetical protein HN348_29315 [Proteobacteria bacterium]|nr:hypothetical protein [Pseudomonadota bacterium]
MSMDEATTKWDNWGASGELILDGMVKLLNEFDPPGRVTEVSIDLIHEGARLQRLDVFKIDWHARGAAHTLGGLLMVALQRAEPQFDGKLRLTCVCGTKRCEWPVEISVGARPWLDDGSRKFMKTILDENHRMRDAKLEMFAASPSVIRASSDAIRALRGAPLPEAPQASQSDSSVNLLNDPAFKDLGESLLALFNSTDAVTTQESNRVTAAAATAKTKKPKFDAWALVGHASSPNESIQDIEWADWLDDQLEDLFNGGGGRTDQEADESYGEPADDDCFAEDVASFDKTRNPDFDDY